VTFKDLKKRVTLEAAQHQSKLSERLVNKPFWIWNIEQHKQIDIRTNGYCCFNHIIGLPTKEGLEKAIFDYEKILYDSLLDNEHYNTLNHSFKHKHLTEHLPEQYQVCLTALDEIIKHAFDILERSSDNKAAGNGAIQGYAFSQVGIALQRYNHRQCFELYNKQATTKGPRFRLYR
jgi:hypothetical protein